MQTYVIAINQRAMTALSDDKTLVSTSSGVDQVRFLFDSDEWLDGFSVSAAFYTPSGLEEVALTLEDTDEEGYIAEATCDVPDSALDADLGPLGVTVHGVDSDPARHIITERAFPLVVEQHGDSEGDAPGPSPYMPPPFTVDTYLPDGATVEWVNRTVGNRTYTAARITWQYDDSMSGQGVVAYKDSSSYLYYTIECTTLGPFRYGDYYLGIATLPDALLDGPPLPTEFIGPEDTIDSVAVTGGGSLVIGPQNVYYPEMGPDFEDGDTIQLIIYIH